MCLVAALTLAAGVATAASPPTPSTGAATAITATSATLNGTVNPQGQATTYYFEYGTTTAYGTKTATASAGSGATNVSASAPVSGLAPGTSYHFRLVATNASGTIDGADATFTTTRAPAPTTGAASAITATSATLNGTVNPESQATTYYFEYGTTTAYGSKTATANAGAGAANAAVSAPISGLAAGTPYHFRLVATNASGTSDGTDATFTTTAAATHSTPVPKPTVRTGGVTAVQPTSAGLRAAVNPNGAATTYFFEYGRTTGYGSRTPETSAGAGRTSVGVGASIGGLLPATTYHYRVIAFNSTGEAIGGDRSFKTAKAPLGVTLSASSGTITFGSGVDLVGRVSGTGAAHALVTIEVAASPGGPFSNLVRDHADSSGAFGSGFLHPAANGFYRAVALGHVSATVAVRVRFRVSFHVSSRHARAGRRVRFSGRIGPAEGGVVLSIQRRVRGRWLLVARTRAKADGSYSRRVRVHHGGFYRVVARPSATNARGTSRRVRITLR